MRPEESRRSKPSFLELIQAIIRLDLPKLGIRSMETHIYTPHTKQRNTRVASVATIRILLVTFTELKSLLSSMCKCHELRSFYESRKVLAQKVLPETFEAFEYCREVLRLRGSTDSPIASKLAQTAYAVGDYIERLKKCVDIAMEYHELRYETIAEITKFADRESFIAANVAPLLFSIEVTLPLRLEIFASRAAEFPDGIERLTDLAQKATHRARKRIESISVTTIDSADRPKPREKAQSPRRPSIKVLRGVRVCQSLSNRHQRIPSLREPLQPQSDKENPPLVVEPVKQPKHSRLRPPSKVENRKVVQAPLSPLKEVPRPRRMNSQILRPTQIVNPQRSMSSLRTLGHKLVNVNNNLSNTSDISMDGLDSNFDCTLEETPLTHKSARPSPNTSSSTSQLLIPRQRSHWVRV